MLPGTHVEKEIRFVGLQRSGNHAVINWILKQCTGNVLFYNDVDPVNPLDDSRIMGDRKELAHIDCLLYSYEDRLLNVIANRKFYPATNTYTTSVKKRYDILIIRDPFNLFASRSKHTVVLPDSSYYISGLSIPDLWLTYAREYLNETSFLSHNKIVVNYNMWCTSKRYRKALASQLELDFSDNGFNEITSYGHGSSFDKLKYNNQANIMKTDSRWSTFKSSQDYLALFANKKIVDYSNSIFDYNQDLDTFIKTRLPRIYSRKESFYSYLRRAFFPTIIAVAKESNFIRSIYNNYFLEIRKKLMLNKRKKKRQ